MERFVSFDLSFVFHCHTLTFYERTNAATSNSRSNLLRKLYGTKYEVKNSQRHQPTSDKNASGWVIIIDCETRRTSSKSYV
jgi:viroplasmin and RNaseH domain-containing protein